MKKTLIILVLLFSSSVLAEKTKLQCECKEISFFTYEEGNKKYQNSEKCNHKKLITINSEDKLFVFHKNQDVIRPFTEITEDYYYTEYIFFKAQKFYKADPRPSGFESRSTEKIDRYTLEWFSEIFLGQFFFYDEKFVIEKSSSSYLQCRKLKQQL